MKRSTLICIVFVTALSGADYDGIVSSCEKAFPTWSRGNDQPVQYSHNAPLNQLFGGETSLNYDLKRNRMTETLSMGAKYSLDQFSAQIQSSYVQGRNDTIPSTGNASLLVRYHKKLWDSLALSASENVYFPTNTSNELVDPMKYTSLLKALYPLNDFYNIFAEGSYSLVQIPSVENTSYRNPYSYTTGITYSRDSDTAINASYMLLQGMDPDLRPNKKIKLAHKHKLSKKIKTSFSVTKSLETDRPDNKASFDLIYAY